MLNIIWAVATAILVLDRFVWNRKPEDKIAREAVKKVAKMINRKMVIYEALERVEFYTEDYEREYECRDKFNKLEEKIHAVREEARDMDRKIVGGVDTLAGHFKVELMPFHIPSQDGVKIVKIKKAK